MCVEHAFKVEVFIIVPSLKKYKYIFNFWNLNGIPVSTTVQRTILFFILYHDYIKTSDIRLKSDIIRVITKGT